MHGPWILNFNRIHGQRPLNIGPRVMKYAHPNVPSPVMKREIPSYLVHICNGFCCIYLAFSSLTGA